MFLNTQQKVSNAIMALGITFLITMTIFDTVSPVVKLHDVVVITVTATNQDTANECIQPDDSGNECIQDTNDECLMSE